MQSARLLHVRMLVTVDAPNGFRMVENIKMSLLSSCMLGLLPGSLSTLGGLLQASDFAQRVLKPSRSEQFSASSGGSFMTQILSAETYFESRHIVNK